MRETIGIPLENLNMKNHKIPIFGDEPSVDFTIIAGTHIISPSNVFQCSNCDYRPYFKVDKTALTAEVDEECKYPNVEAYKTSINVNSEALIFSDRLFKELPTPDLPSINSHLGQRIFSENSAKEGVASGCIGNTSPGVFYNETTNHILIADFYFEGENVPEGYHRVSDYSLAPNNYASIGTICTDTWMYQFMDSAAYEQTPEDNKIDRSRHVIDTIFTMQVPNGEWEFTHHPHRYDYEELDADEEFFMPVIYAEATLKGV